MSSIIVFAIEDIGGYPVHDFRFAWINIAIPTFWTANDIAV
jgi:hypothetical protein